MKSLSSRFILQKKSWVRYGERMVKWSKLEESVGQTVTLKGFLYERDGGDWILSDQPNLRSCCAAKSKNHVILEGVFPKEKISKAICMRGTLSTQALELNPYTLNDASLVEGRPVPSFTLLIAVGIAVAFLLWKRVKSAFS